MRLRANFNWKLLLFVVIFLPITVRLGFWQLDRADEKRVLAEQFTVLVDLPAADFQQLSPKERKNYRPVTAMGRFNQQVFLLDNQVYQGKFGYEVIQGFELSDGELLLVSRGFLPGNLDRSILPEIKTPTQPILLSGYLYKSLDSLELADNQLSKTYPQVIQNPSGEKLYKHLLKSDRIGHPFLLRLAEESPYSFAAHWQIINVSPEKHLGYALQWFLMAAVLLLMFLYASIKIDKEDPDNDNTT
jgi:surfeit locus 1 family protein